MTIVSAKTVNFDYRERALEFQVGDTVAPLGATLVSGRVTAVWPAIGMVDVEWPTGHKRCPVEDIVIAEVGAAPPLTDNTPGGPAFHPGMGESKKASPMRVAQAWIKKSVYWAAKDRKYKATRDEINSKSYHCPKCKQDDLRRTSYKRWEGKSTKLLVCPSCLFTIRVKDLEGCHWNDGCEPALGVL